MKQKLQEEVTYYDDMIVLDLEESYDNLVLKVDRTILEIRARFRYMPR